MANDSASLHRLIKRYAKNSRISRNTWPYSYQFKRYAKNSRISRKLKQSNNRCSKLFKYGKLKTKVKPRKINNRLTESTWLRFISTLQFLVPTYYEQDLSFLIRLWDKSYRANFRWFLLCCWNFVFHGLVKTPSILIITNYSTNNARFT